MHLIEKNEEFAYFLRRRQILGDFDGFLNQSDVFLIIGLNEVDFLWIFEDFGEEMGEIEGSLGSHVVIY